MTMSTRARIRNGTAVAAVLIAASQTLGGQRPATTRSRGDSVFVRVFAPNMMSLDSLRLLLQEFDREQYGTPRWVALRARIDSLFPIPGGANATALVGRMLAGAETGRMMSERRGWLGLNTQGPNRQLTENGELYVTQFAYPLIVTVDPQSPAEKAGIMGGDILVAYNGVDVVNHEFNLTTLLKPDSKITVTVRRDGETKDYQLVVAKAPQRISDLRYVFEAPVPAGFGGRRGEGPDGARRPGAGGTIIAGPRGLKFSDPMMPGSSLFVITPNGVFGAAVSTVNNALAKVLNVRAGVLVNDVPEGSPAFRAGLRTGDVIIGVGDEAVVSLTELRQRVAALAHERAIALQVASPNQKTRTVSVSLAPTPSP
ncbi:MAG TPA: PDZ domain-containing protein [Gemmatimonadaceae bacterium]|nr:PDZ domain-containing protein [Gemmatimonadaceae bacterium]